MTTKGFRFRSYPSDPVAGVLLRWIGCQRFIKNAKCREDRYYRAFQKRFAAFAGMHTPVDQAYSHLIGDGGGCEDATTTWLREVPSHVLRNGAALFYTGYQRFFKGLARRPTIQSKYGKQSVWLTSELFEFKPTIDADGEITGYCLFIGTKKFPCGELAFTVNKGKNNKPMPWTPPASIHVSVNAGRWHISFSNEVKTDLSAYLPSEKETLEQLRSFSAADLAAKTVGLDRGVTVPLMAASASGPSQSFDLLPIQRKRLAKKEIRRARWQRIAARRVKGSKNRRKANLKAARCTIYGADVRENFAHQTSRALVNSDNLLFVFEALKVKNMTASAAGTKAAPGKKVAQKRGLNRSILASAWGQTKLFTKYKALAAGKLCIEVPPQYSSQECSQCGFTHADNRITQDRFVCQRCAHAENADTNAGRVLSKRGVNAVISGSYTLKEKKKVGGLRRAPDETSGPPKVSESNNSTTNSITNSIGQELSESGMAVSSRNIPTSKSVETLVSRSGPRPPAPRSRKQKCLEATQDTPTTRPYGV